MRKILRLLFLIAFLFLFCLCFCLLPAGFRRSEGKKEKLMQYKCMEREMRTLSMEGFYFPSVMYIAIIPAGMQL